MGLTRRGALKTGLGAGALFLPRPWAWVWAQSEGAVKLLRAPKVALVVGNSKYKEAPLKNPANDAKAIGETLKGAGFEVTMKLDTGREELLAAIREYVRAMEQKKCVGLFYFAGHGLQLAWRNYLLPVDAAIDKIDDVARQSIDIARLMEGLTKAANPMNVIILDACRDNPFGNLKGVDQKGLSATTTCSRTRAKRGTSARAATRSACCSTPIGSRRTCSRRLRTASTCSPSRSFCAPPSGGIGRGWVSFAASLLECSPMRTPRRCPAPGPA